MADEYGAAGTTPQEHQLVVFQLASELYGVDIGVVNTVIRMQEATRIPHAPDFVEGTVNVRGSIVPVVDLRKRFDLPPAENTRSSRIIVTEIDDQMVGLVVDRVVETARPWADSAEPSTPLIASSDSSCAHGIGKLHDDPVVLLDQRKMLSDEESLAPRRAESRRH